MMRAGLTSLSLTTLALLLACGGGGSSGPSSTAANIAGFAGDSQVAAVSTTLPESLAVLVTDAGAHPVAGVLVSWSAIGTGTVSPATSHTDANGIAKTTRTLGATAGHGKTTAAVTGLTAFQFEAVGQVQGAVTIATQGVGPYTDTVLGTLSDSETRPSVKVVDQNDLPVAGVNVVWSASGGGSVVTATVPTDTAGISRVNYTFGASKGSAYQAKATVVGLINSPVTFLLTADPGVPTTLAVGGGDGFFVEPGGQIGQSAKVSDGHGNAVGNVRIDWAASSGGGSVSPTVDSTAPTGLALTTRTLGSASGLQKTTATAPTLAGGPSVTLNTIAARLVKVVNNAFNPSTKTIVAGDSVTWQWQGVTAAHNITFAPIAGAPADEGDRTSGVVVRVFSDPGTYSFQCTNHPGMTGTITVTP